jgi:sugar phosphate isomerase/epimerase
MELIARELNDLALLAKKQGVTVHYHNHSWEFENDALIFKSIGRYASDLCFGLDTGWAFYSGYDPVELMDQYPGRFHYVHIRDFNKTTREFVDLGSGDMDFTRLMKKLSDILGPEDWAVVEYETGAEDMNRYKLAFEYMKQYVH